MNTAELIVCQSAVFKVLGNINLTAYKVRVAEAALTASAACRNGKTVLFDGLHNGIRRFTENDLGLILNCTRDFNLFGNTGRIILLSFGVVEFAEHLVTDVFLFKAELFDFLIDKGVHLL